MKKTGFCFGAHPFHRLRHVLLFCALWIAGCQPSPQSNVLGYVISTWLGTQPPPVSSAPPGALVGRILDEAGRPIAGASVIVAQPDGLPHHALTDADGVYSIAGIPPGQYVPAAVAPGFAEAALTGLFGLPKLVTIQSNVVTKAPALTLKPYRPTPLPENLAEAIHLRQTAVYTATATFPENAAADVAAYAFDFEGAVVDTLRVYLPMGHMHDASLPLLFMVYPSPVDNWQDVSVAFASERYAVVAISPTAARGVDAEAHAQDARVALALARRGAFGPAVGDNRPMAMGGSFSSAILSRLLRSAGDELTGWVTVGGLANAFTAAHDFYTGRISIPPPFELLVPALGPPNLYPLPFLMFSPVYVAGELPPTMIIHTAADEILRIEQAYALAEAVAAAGVPLETYYYEDESHYLGIGADLTDAGREMFYRILDFIERYGERP
ncbi:MAG: carboxypeptidase regulatory-like domain-containing protein [Caldilinea sp.]|nr:carboxypeptidase regulatory-like domain-containing protein [Caldilinea sp.]MDW8442731.1 carboxypeptidase regulatory-like domain-containing protein [Caldilineaceae bacterium]